jgi:hypothetical protein
MVSQPKIIVSGFEVIFSGTIVTYAQEYVDIYSEPAAPYHLKLSFLEGSPGQSASLTVNQEVTNQTQVICQNFNSASGSATASPLYVMNWSGNKVSLNFASYIIGSGPGATRVTHYSLLKGELLNAWFANPAIVAARRCALGTCFGGYASS